MDDLSISLEDLNIGGKIGGRHLNHLFYGDDVCLISLSTAGMQKHLNVCQDYALSHELLFNSKKSICMKFVTKYHMQVVTPMTLMGSEISFVDHCKYLGTLIVYIYISHIYIHFHNIIIQIMQCIQSFRTYE